MSMGVQQSEFDQSGDRGRDSSSQFVVPKIPIFLLYNSYNALKFLKRCVLYSTRHIFFFFGRQWAYKDARLVRYDIAAGIVPVSSFQWSSLFFVI